MKKLAMYLSMTLLATVLSTLALASPTGNTDPTYSFTLDGPQAAGDPNTGNTALVTGSGSFDTAESGTVIGSGSFPILQSTGGGGEGGPSKDTPFCKFCLFCGLKPGAQGGGVNITVTP